MKKITFETEGIYGTILGTNYWAFVKEVKGGFTALGDPQSCKDYTHEAFCNVVHKKSIKTFAGYGPKSGVTLDKMRLVMFFDNSKATKKIVNSTKRILNHIERKNGLPTTKMTEVKIVSNKNKGKHGLKSAFVFVADKAYIESPALLHGMIAFLRTMHLYGKPVTYKNILKVLKSENLRDADVLKYVCKYDIMGVLIKNHAKITKGLSLKSVYPKKVTNVIKGNQVNSYHSGFGMVALSRRKLASKAYSKRVLKVLDANNIPKKED